MKISDCIIQLARAKEMYGDIDVVILDQDNLRTPIFLHSHKDYYDVKESDVNMFISDSSWEELGL